MKKWATTKVLMTERYLPKCAMEDYKCNLRYEGKCTATELRELCPKVMTGFIKNKLF